MPAWRNGGATMTKIVLATAAALVCTILPYLLVQMIGL
jgi:hypothetical protein